MTKRIPGFLAPGRAIWPACLAFVMIGVVSGCGDATDPVAPAAPVDIDATADLDGYVAYVDPVELELETDAAMLVSAPGFGRWIFDGDTTEPVMIDVLPDEAVQFFWRALDGAGLAGRATFRYGWNVADPDDPDDPGWFGPPSASFKMQQTQPVIVSAGTAELLIERWDRGRLLRRASIQLWSMPVDP